MTNPQWFVITTNPNCQMRAQYGLNALGYETCLPMSRRWVTHARVKKAKEKPLLGRYMFVKVDYPSQSFGSVRSCNGVESILGFGGDPKPVRASFVEDIRLEWMRGAFDEIGQADEPYPTGARIKIMEGKFADHLATITGKKHGLYFMKLMDKRTEVRDRINNIRPWSGEVVPA